MSERYLNPSCWPLIPHLTSRISQRIDRVLSLQTRMQLSTIVALAFATLAVATPTRRNSAPSSPGDVCCKSVTTADNPTAAAIFALLGIVVQDINAVVGLTCTDVTVIGNAATW
jgi:hypothetical protein